MIDVESVQATTTAFGRSSLFRDLVPGHADPPVPAP